MTRAICGAALALAALAAGCSDPNTPVPVGGVVTLDGVPVDGATVNFYTAGGEAQARPAHGATGKDGAFRLSTMGDGDGAARRKYKVVITRYVPSRPDLKVPTFPDTQEGRDAKADFLYRNFEAKGVQPFKNALPAKYGSSETTPLECEVTGETTVKFDLSSK
jgi:hypothetical protein